jgi:hypothetical protein
MMRTAQTFTIAATPPPIIGELGNRHRRRIPDGAVNEPSVGSAHRQLRRKRNDPGEVYLRNGKRPISYKLVRFRCCKKEAEGPAGARAPQQNAQLPRFHILRGSCGLRLIVADILPPVIPARALKSA